MARSFVNYTTDGSTTVWTVPFDYLDRSHVKVLVDNATIAFSWITSGSVSTAAQASGHILTVRRETPKSPLVDFQDGSVLSQADLDKASIQSLYVAEEAIEGIESGAQQAFPDGTYTDPWVIDNVRVWNNAGTLFVKAGAAPSSITDGSPLDGGPIPGGTYSSPFLFGTMRLWNNSGALYYKNGSNPANAADGTILVPAPPAAYSPPTGLYTDPIRLDTTRLWSEGGILRTKVGANPSSASDGRKVSAAGTWDDPLAVDSGYFWNDGTNLRFKTTAPTSQFDGRPFTPKGGYQTPIHIGDNSGAVVLYLWAHAGNLYYKSTVPTSATDGTNLTAAAGAIAPETDLYQPVTRITGTTYTVTRDDVVNQRIILGPTTGDCVVTTPYLADLGADRAYTISIVRNSTGSLRIVHATGGTAVSPRGEYIAVKDGFAFVNFIGSAGVRRTGGDVQTTA